MVEPPSTTDTEGPTVTTAATDHPSSHGSVHLVRRIVLVTVLLAGLVVPPGTASARPQSANPFQHEMPPVVSIHEGEVHRLPAPDSSVPGASDDHVRFPIELSHRSREWVGFRLRTRDGTARHSTGDYTRTVEQVTIRPGDLEVFVDVPIRRADDGPYLAFSAELDQLDGATAGVLRASALLADDGRPHVLVGDAVIDALEPESPDHHWAAPDLESAALFPVRLSAPLEPGTSATVSLSVWRPGASAADHQGRVTFTADGPRTLWVPAPLDRFADRMQEQMHLRIDRPPANVHVGRWSGVAELEPSVTVHVVPPAGDEPPTSVVYVLTRTQYSHVEYGVDYRLGGTAVRNRDYDDPNPPGEHGRVWFKEDDIRHTVEVPLRPGRTVEDVTLQLDWWVPGGSSWGTAEAVIPGRRHVARYWMFAHP
jgi:hypothetical protein